MTRAILNVVLIVLVGVFVGCAAIDSGQGQLLPADIKQSPGSAAVAKVTRAGESDIIEQVAINRKAYRGGLELLIKHYIKTGNNMKLMWANKELRALDAIPQYNYIIEAGVAGSGLKASVSIPDADELYSDGLELEKKAGPLPFLKNEDLLRLALDKYNQLIRKHPSSDKIDDAAYRAGGIYEYFKDYTIALLYFQRTYQWEPDTLYPARFRAAFILDTRLSRRAEALELYRQAVKLESRHEKWKEYAEKRIREFTKSDEDIK